MPFNPSTGIYTPPAGAESATPGATISSATWNAIFTDISLALSQLAQNTQPVLGVVLSAIGVNFNAGNTDTAILIVLPANCTRFLVMDVIISHASGTLTTATAGLFTGTGGTGTAIVTGGSAITVNTASESTVNNAQSMTVNNAGTQSYNVANLFFRVGNPQGSAATGNVTIRLKALP